MKRSKPQPEEIPETLDYDLCTSEKLVFFVRPLDYINPCAEVPPLPGEPCVLNPTLLLAGKRTSAKYKGGTTKK